MPYFHRFMWTGKNKKHIGEHDVTEEEFEEVVLKAPKRAAWINQESGHWNVIGRTSAGRMILCAYDEIDEITCYPVTAHDKEIA